MATHNKRLFLIDGSALAYRSYFAFIRNPLINSKGENTSAVFGFCRALIKILNDEKPDYIAVVFDTPHPTFRHEMYEEYKANREKAPGDFVEQLPRIKQIVEAFAIPIIEKPGYEADDIIGTLAKKAENYKIEACLVSGDKDFMQLVSKFIKIYNPKRSGEDVEILDETGVVDKIGLPPAKIIDYLALMGDSSDNVPGVPGIGPKNAVSLLQEFGDLDNVLSHADEVKRKSIQNALKENVEIAQLSKKLVTILCDVDVDVELEQLTISEPDKNELLALFKDLEFASLFELISAKSQTSSTVTYSVINSEQDLDDLMHILEKRGSFAIDLETTALNPINAEIVGISFSNKAGEAFYVPFITPPTDQKVWTTPEKIINKLRPLFENDQIKKCGHNIKFDLAVLRGAGVELAGVDFDTMIASYLLNPSARQHNLDSLSFEYFNHKKIQISELIGKGKNQKSMAAVPLEQIAPYACEDADFTWRLREEFEPKLIENNLFDLFQDVEMPLMPVLLQMELDGVSLDVPYLQDMSRAIEHTLTDLQKEIYKIAGEKFNINSTQQLGKILFKKLQLPTVRRTKTGFSTDVAVLEKLSKRHPLPKNILEYRQLAKLKSTYIDALPKLVNPKTNRLHTSFNQTVTATGRLSSSDPNLQNIPIRTEIGRQIRKAFVPEDENHIIFDADYSQIELRIMAHLSGDETLRQAFIEDEDVHKRTAALVFDIKPQEVTFEHRRRAKEVNFGIMYGMGAYGLSSRLDIPLEEAEAFIGAYFATYPKVHKYILSTLDKAREHGFVTTVKDRRRYLPEIHSDNRRMREFAERTAINMPVQGSAADLIKVAMINISKVLKEGNFRTKMILQVHDELVFEVPKNELDEIKQLVPREMINAIKLDVPVKVDVGIGQNWLEAH